MIKDLHRCTQATAYVKNKTDSSNFRTQRKAMVVTVLELIDFNLITLKKVN